MGLDEIRHALEASARHAERTFASDGVEIRLPCKRCAIELRDPLEGDKAEICTAWPKASVIEESVFGKSLASKPGIPNKDGTGRRL